VRGIFHAVVTYMRVVHPQWSSFSESSTRYLSCLRVTNKLILQFSPSFDHIHFSRSRKDFTKK
jgi:hypothetical protein